MWRLARPQRISEMAKMAKEAAAVATAQWLSGVSMALCLAAPSAASCAGEKVININPGGQLNINDVKISNRLSWPPGVWLKAAYRRHDAAR